MFLLLCGSFIAISNIQRIQHVLWIYLSLGIFPHQACITCHATNNNYALKWHPIAWMHDVVTQYVTQNSNFGLWAHVLLLIGIWLVNNWFWKLKQDLSHWCWTVKRTFFFQCFAVNSSSVRSKRPSCMERWKGSTAIIAGYLLNRLLDGI